MSEKKINSNEQFKKVYLVLENSKKFEVERNDLIIGIRDRSSVRGANHL